MPFIDPGLRLAGSVGPGRENRADDLVRLASAIERNTGAVVLKDGPTRDALRGTGRPDATGGFAPLPKIAQSVGPRAPNRPQDMRTLQGKLASLGYAPRVAERPLFPRDAAKRPSTPPFHPPSDGAGRPAAVCKTCLTACAFSSGPKV